MTDSGGETVGLSGLLDRVDGSMETLTLYNYDGPEEVIEDLSDHFGRRLVMVREADTQYGEPAGVALLHDAKRFIAASDVEAVHDAVTTVDQHVIEDPAFGWEDYPDVLRHMTTTGFTFEKPRMVLASREIERRAWRARTGELRAGFQKLSHIRDQWELYAEMATQGVDVHVYGAPDWELPSAPPITVHRSTDREIRDHWFVAYDSGGSEKGALLSEQLEPDLYQGFWTFDPSLVDDLFAHLRGGRTTDPDPDPEVRAETETETESGADA